MITDVYGYGRLTGASTIAHKGTDFRASIGTPVYAMNSGVVAYTSFLRNYGNTVVLDHGLGLQTIYMHLSKVLVKNGDSVSTGDLIARSGDTGYVLGPHLHLTVRIGGISIDPMRFLAILGERNKVEKIVAFGDSLTQGVGSQVGGGFVTFLSSKLQVPIENSGVSGSTTSDALARIDSVVGLKPDLTLVLLGGNDFLQKIPEATTLKNLREIINKLQSAGSSVVLIGLESQGGNLHDRTIFESLAHEYGVVFVPNILGDIWGRENLMSDSLHPNDEGYKLMADKLEPVLKNFFESK